VLENNRIVALKKINDISMALIFENINVIDMSLTILQNLHINDNLANF